MFFSLTREQKTSKLLKHVNNVSFERQCSLSFHTQIQINLKQEKNFPKTLFSGKIEPSLFESCILVTPASSLVSVSMAVSDTIFVKTPAQTSFLIKLIYFKLLHFFLFQGWINLSTAAGLGSSPFSSLFFVPSLRTVVMMPYLFYLVSFDFIFMKLCQVVSHKSTQISLVFIGTDTNICLTTSTRSLK